jgi:SAM-dependent methyltransferase
MYPIRRGAQLLAKLPRQLLTVDFIRYVLCLCRYVWLSRMGHRVRVLEKLPPGVARNTIMHNLKGVRDLAAPRSHRLIRPLVAIDRVRDRQKQKRVLTVGPRVEGELFNLIGYGFARRNVRGLDLITYSPFVDLGDMHAMPYEDSTFDVVILGWVLAYSDDKKAAAQEVIRVAKPGAVVAIGVSWNPRSNEKLQQELGYVPGSEVRLETSADVLALFAGHVAKVYFSQDPEPITANKVSGIVAIFCLEKP